MTDVNEKSELKDNESVTTLSKRLHRRSLLKAGAIAAPFAMTLHSGAAATALGNHASSAGLCVLDLREIATNPNHPRNEYMQVPINGGRIARRRDRRRHNGRINARDCEDGTRLEPFDPRNRVHWDFIKDSRNARFGMSCINSIEFGQYRPGPRRRRNNRVT